MNRQNNSALKRVQQPVLAKADSERDQALIDKAYKLARIGTWDYDMITGKLTWSTLTKEVHGFDEDYVPDVESTIMLFKEGFHRDTFAKAANDAIEKEIPFDVELKIISGKGDERWIRATGEPEYKDGKCIRFYGISQNVTNRKQAEEDLQLNEQRFKALVQDGSDMISILDEEARYIYVSPTSRSILGIPSETFIGKSAFEFIHEEDQSMIREVLSVLSSVKRIEIEPYRVMDSDGNWRWIETTVTNMKDGPAVRGLVANSRDITEKKRQQQQLLESLKEKDTLLSEIHHRVKNNLAVVSGLLQVQVSKEKDPNVITRLEDSISRIQTMSQVHEQLYLSTSFTMIDLAENFQELTMKLLKSHRTDIQLDVDFQCQPVKVTINDAIPCSLIFNEVITNILKHAYVGRESGKITVSLEFINDEACLTITDNGVGLPENFKVKGSTSFGLMLIDVLTDQIGGVFTFSSTGEGAVFSLRFTPGDQHNL